MTKNTNVSTDFNVDISTKTDVDKGKSCWVCQIEIQGDLRLSTSQQFKEMRDFICAEVAAKMLESKHHSRPNDDKLDTLWDSIVSTIAHLELLVPRT